MIKHLLLYIHMYVFTGIYNIPYICVYECKYKIHVISLQIHVCITYASAKQPIENTTSIILNAAGGSTFIWRKICNNQHR